MIESAKRHRYSERGIERLKEVRQNSNKKERGREKDIASDLERHVIGDERSTDQPVVVS